MKYSDKEVAMFTALGFGHLVNSSISESGIYRIVLEDAFINNKQGKAVESLRRTTGALAKCSPYRMTPEFDALIELD